MAVARSTCLRCCLEVAADQTVDPLRELCGRCQQPMSIPAIIVGSNGIHGLRQALFNRLQPPRALSPVRALVGNIALEQFHSWRTPSWTLVGISHTPKEDKETYLLSEWEDVKALCSFQVVAQGTRDPTQAYGNVRTSLRGSAGIICPPVLLTHRYVLHAWFNFMTCYLH
jgi:hypothetical protein